jgi:hypothetical protein
MANALAPRSSALAVPTRHELESLGAGDRWTRVAKKLADHFDVKPSELFPLPGASS